MTTPPRRSFSLADAMILVAAIGIGLAASRSYYSSLTEVYKGPGLKTLSRPRIAYVWPYLAAMTFGVPVLRASRSRAGYRCSSRLPGLPGLAACHAGVVGIAIAVATGLYHMALSSDPGRVATWSAIMVHRLPQFAAPAVAAVWATMWWSGRWRPESDWVGGLGRVLGIGWIVLFLLLELQIWT